jgi:hypothetical protein
MRMTGLPTLPSRWHVASTVSAPAQVAPSMPVICSTAIMPVSSCSKMWQWTT